MTAQAITLDVGHTLLFPHPSVGHVYTRVGNHHGMQIDARAVEVLFPKHWERCQLATTGLIYGTTHEEALDFWHRVNHGVLTDMGVPTAQLQPFVADLYATFGRAECWRVNPDLQDLLHACQDQRIAVGIISNWDLRLRALLDELHFTTWADPVLISAEECMEKPDARLFHAAASRLGLPPAAILHIGDTWNDDIVAARACGMQAAWFNPSGAPSPEPLDGAFDVQSLRAILPMLEHRH